MTEGLNKNMSQCLHAYTHHDFDGAVSLLTLFWAMPQASITFKGITNANISKLAQDLVDTNKPCKTFILDLALREEFLPDLDKENIIFIDHHETSENFIPRFKYAKILHKTTTSNALWMSSIFKGEKFPERTRDQKVLIALADDYDCYRLDIPESYDLNLIFWAQYRNNFKRFINDYSAGFKPFTEDQKRIIANIKAEAERDTDNLKLFSGEVIVEGKPRQILAYFTDTFKTTVIDTLMARHNPHLLIFVNPTSEKVCVRQNNKIEDPINVGAFTEKYCDGGGHRHAGGGKITDLFLELTKNFKPFKG